MDWSDLNRVSAHTTDQNTALTEMARIIANRLDVDVCSIYAVEAGSGDLVLAATMGLLQSSVGTVRMSPTQGLVGLVAQELQPVLAADASAHSRFLHFPEAGEDPYVSFLGIPILLNGILRGVLVVQTTEPRDLTTDWAAVATAARELAPFVVP